VKAQDALDVLQHVSAAVRGATLVTPQGRVDFPVTDAWIHIQRAALEPCPENDNARSIVTANELIEEAQLAGPDTFDEVVRVATWRALCLALKLGMHESTDQVAALDGMSEDAMVNRLSPKARRLVIENVPGALRVLRLYDSLATRAAAKRALRARQDELAAYRDAKLLKVYFRQRLKQPVPRDVHAFAERLGFDDYGALVRAIAVEVAYLESSRLRLCADESGSAFELP
jgi:hypothetical protein